MAIHAESHHAYRIRLVGQNKTKQRTHIHSVICRQTDKQTIDIQSQRERQPQRQRQKTDIETGRRRQTDTDRQRQLQTDKDSHRQTKTAVQECSIDVRMIVFAIYQQRRQSLNH